MWGTIHSTPVQATKLVRFPGAVIVLTAAFVLHPPLQVFRSRAPAFLNSQDIIAYSLNCPADDTSANCLQRAFVMRMTFAHALFHLVCNRPCHPSLVHDIRFLVFGVGCLVLGVWCWVFGVGCLVFSGIRSSMRLETQTRDLQPEA